MYVLEVGGILINEVAPRQHNSCHGTIDGYAESQYDLLIDAITDEKLQTPQRSKDFVMVNLLGNDLHKVDGEDGSSIDDLHVHKYGKEPKK